MKSAWPAAGVRGAAAGGASGGGGAGAAGVDPAAGSGGQTSAPRPRETPTRVSTRIRGKSQLCQNPVTRIRFSGAPFNEKAVSGQLSAISQDMYGRDGANLTGRTPPAIIPY